jgi:hypothetical protein
MTRPDPARLVIPAGLVGAGGLLLSVAAFALDPVAAAHAWLFATLFFLGLSLGAMALRAIHGLTGGTWGFALSGPLRAMTLAMPLAALGFLPLLLFLDVLFAWRAASPPDPLVTAKLAYMATPFLVARLIACLAAFFAAAFLTGLATIVPPAPRRAVAALVLWAVGLLFFATDWMIAPDPRFYSTIYPVLEAGSEMLAALATAILVATLVRPFANPVTGEEHDTRLSEDLANLLFGFLLLLVYLAFMQWLVVWSGDLPEEIGWYLARGAGLRLAILVIAVLLAIAATAGLLHRPTKRWAQGLATLAGAILLATFLHAFWRLRGGFAGAAITWPDVVAFFAMGGLWLALCLHILARRGRLVAGLAHG